MNDWRQVSAKLGGISRSTVWQLWTAGALASVTIGRRRFSTDRQLAAYISGLEKASA